MSQSLPPADDGDNDNDDDDGGDDDNDGCIPFSDGRSCLLIPQLTISSGPPPLLPATVRWTFVIFLLIASSLFIILIVLHSFLRIFFLLLVFFLLNPALLSGAPIASHRWTLRAFHHPSFIILASTIFFLFSSALTPS